VLLAATVAFPKHPSDEAGYWTLAGNLVHGDYTGLGWRPANPVPSPDPHRPDLWFGPGFPLVLTPFSALGIGLGAARLVDPLVLFAAVLAFYALLRRRLAPLPASAGSIAFGLYFPFYSLLPNLHSEPLAILLSVIVLYAVTAYLETGATRYAALGGLAVAWLAVTRVEYGWVATLALVGCVVWWLLWRSTRARRAATTFAVGLVLCVPWLVFTYTVTHRPFLWGNSGPLSLYWMSSPYPQDLGDWRGGAHEIVVSDPRLAPHRPLFIRLAKLDPDEQNRQLERTAWRNIRDHPRKYLENVAANLSRLSFDTPFSDKPEGLNTLFYLVPNAILLGLLAVVVAFVAVGRRGWPIEAPVVAIFGASSLLTHAVVAGYPRMLMPAIPLAFWFVAVGLHTFAGRRVATWRKPQAASDSYLPV
jgi:hypothetical protein